MKSRLLALLVLLVLLAIACSDVERDSVPPDIAALSINGKSFEPGESVIVLYSVSDNLELEQARSRIRGEFSKSFGEWKIVRIDDIGGKSHAGQMEFVVPDTALAGLYSLSFQASDTRGNGTADSAMYFTVMQPGLGPSIHVFETEPPLEGGRFLGDENSFLTFSAILADNEGLARAEVSFQGVDHRVLRNVSQPVDSLLLFGWEYADTIRFSEFSGFPESIVVKATNLTGHQTRLVIPVEAIE